MKRVAKKAARLTRKASQARRTLPANSVTLVTAAIDGPRDKRFYEPDKLMVKFADKYTVRLRKNRLQRIGSKAGLSPRLEALIGNFLQWKP